MSLPETIVTEPSIAVPVGTAEAAVGRRSALGLRAWLFTALLFLVPLLTYWPATFHDFGLRDDYSNLREAHEEPGKVVQILRLSCAADLRLAAASHLWPDQHVQNLHWMRFAASLLLGALSWVSFRGLRALGWSFNTVYVLPFCWRWSRPHKSSPAGPSAGRTSQRRCWRSVDFSPSKAH